MLNFDMDIKFYKQSLNNSKTHFSLLIALILFSLGILIFDFYLIHGNEQISNFVLIGMGMIISNIVWFICESMKAYSDIKSTGHALAHYEEFSRRDEYRRRLEALRGAEIQNKAIKTYYEDFLKANAVCPENTPPESESPEVEK
jgi:hypothetical protein